jgi:predicted transcriptional regulator
MDAAEADLKAGRTVRHDEVFRELDQSIAEMQAEMAGASR